jgi:hypothetical protein
LPARAIHFSLMTKTVIPPFGCNWPSGLER